MVCISVSVSQKIARLSLINIAAIIFVVHIKAFSGTTWLDLFWIQISSY